MPLKYVGNRRNKFNNQPQKFGDLRFDSKMEAARAAELRWLESRGMIQELEMQKKNLRYPMVVNGVKVTTYEADFRYRDEHGKVIVEDVKGHITPEYRIKRALMKALYGIDIVEVFAKPKKPRVLGVRSRPPLSRKPVS